MLDSTGDTSDHEARSDRSEAQDERRDRNDKNPENQSRPRPSSLAITLATRHDDPEQRNAGSAYPLAAAGEYRGAKMANAIPSSSNANGTTRTGRAAERTLSEIRQHRYNAA